MDIGTILKNDEAWFGQEVDKLKTWAGHEIQEGEQELADLGKSVVSGATSLATKIAPVLLGSLATAWKNFMAKAESGSLDAPAIEQGVIQEAEVLGEDVLQAVTTMGSPELQAIFAVFKIVFPAL